MDPSRKGYGARYSCKNSSGDSDTHSTHYSFHSLPPLCQQLGNAGLHYVGKNVKHKILEGKFESLSMGVYKLFSARFLHLIDIR